jgi:phosphoglycolate phosphatase
MNERALLFDLDGTLLDTLADITTAANAVLRQQGFPTHPTDDYRRFIGDGVIVLFQRILPRDVAQEAPIAEFVAAFREEYARCWNVQTRLYDGISELLDELSARDHPLAILSNKPDEFTRKCAAEYLSAWPFRAVLGQREGVPRKPDPAGAFEVASRLEIDVAECLYVGDSPVDVETALRAGMRPIGVSWGFRAPEELLAAGAETILAVPADLLRLLP